MNEFEYKFSLWQFDVVTDFNRTTQLVRNRSTGRLMVKKIMPAYEFEVHNAVSKINNCHIAKVFDVITDRNACIILEEYVQGHTIEQYLSKGTFAGRLCHKYCPSDLQRTQCFAQIFNYPS